MTERMVRTQETLGNLRIVGLVLVLVVVLQVAVRRTEDSEVEEG